MGCMWLCLSKVLCGLLEVFAIVKVSFVCFYFDNLEVDIFDAGGLPCYSIMFVTITVRIQTFQCYF